MKYRQLGNTGMLVSEISLGCEHLVGKDYEAIKAIIDKARMAGFNLMDVFMSNPEVRTDIGKALAGIRQSVIIQGHLGSCWVDGQYSVMRDLPTVKANFEDLLTRLNTDYIDIGMLHFIDDENEWDSLVDSEYMKYALELKRSRVIRAIGMSCHNPVTALKAVKSGLIDVLMFSINPAFDIRPKDLPLDAVFEQQDIDYSAFSLEPARAELYRECEERGVGITVMKALECGALLSKERSPLGVAMTVPQCLNYALTRPGVGAIMLGIQKPEEIDDAMRYWEVSDEDRDYTKVLSKLGMFTAVSRCMYCNHCLPCPSNIDIAAVNKYLDLVDIDGNPADSVKAHYMGLKAKASDCVKCGACESRCPFNVPVRQRMERAQEVFNG